MLFTLKAYMLFKKIEVIFSGYETRCVHQLIVSPSTSSILPHLEWPSIQKMIAK